MSQSYTLIHLALPPLTLNLQELARHMDLRYNFDTLEEYLTTGEKIAGEGRILEAVAVMREGAQRFPDSAPANYNLGTALLMLVREDKSRHELWEDVADEEVLLDEAVASFQAAIDQDATMVPAYNNLARALALSGRSEDAMAVWERSLELSPDQEEVRADLKMYRDQLAPKSEDRAEQRLLREAMEPREGTGDGVAPGGAGVDRGTPIDQIITPVPGEVPRLDTQR